MSMLSLPLVRALALCTLTQPPLEGEHEDHREDEADYSREVVVHAEPEQRESARGASHFRIDRDLLEAAPRKEAAEMLNSAPGVFVARGEGGSVAHHYVLRGFDAEHGQDIAMHVGGLPINLPSHIHGQGYADLSPLIAEVVDDIHVSEGVYDPRQGDFAVAGSFDIHLGVHDRGLHTQGGYGRFGSTRAQAVWAPRGASERSFGALRYERTLGFGENRAGQSASALAQLELGSGEGPWTHRLITLLHASRHELAGVLRRDDVDAGRIGFYQVYPHASARAQHALATRAMLGSFHRRDGEAGEWIELGVWAGIDEFRLAANYTGFVESSQLLEGVSGRGDLIAQDNRTRSVGALSRYRTRWYQLGRWAHGNAEVGFDGRVDRIDQGQELIDAAVHGQIWDRRVDAEILSSDLGAYADLEWWLGPRLRWRVGGRADALFFDVRDELGNFVATIRPEDQSLPGVRRSAAGVAAGPRSSVELLALSWLSLRGAYGEGYRSPSARTLEAGERAPISKVRSADLGVRMSASDAHELSVAGYWTHLGDDVAFEASEGRLERIGATRRVGTVVHARTRPVPPLLAGASLTWVRAQLLEPPPASAEDPQPAFEPGQRLPYVPPITVRADLGAQGVLARRGEPWELRGRLGMGLSYLSARPLPHGAFAEPVPLLDAAGGLESGPFRLDLSVFNLLNRRYAAVEYNYASSWDPQAPRPRVPARHFAAGAPLSVMLMLGVSL